MTKTTLVSKCGTPAGMFAIAILGLIISIIFAVVCPKTVYAAGECTAVAKTVKKPASASKKSVPTQKPASAKKAVATLERITVFVPNAPTDAGLATRREPSVEGHVVMRLHAFTDTTPKK